MAVGIDDQYKLIFSVQGLPDDPYYDFLETDQLKEFRLIESSGNILPSWEMSFTINDSKIIPVVQENNVIEVSFGLGELEYVVALCISSTRIEETNTSEFTIILSGLLNKYGYLTDSALLCDKVSGVKMLDTVVSKYFKFLTNVKGGGGGG